MPLQLGKGIACFSSKASFEGAQNLCLYFFMVDLMQKVFYNAVFKYFVACTLIGVDLFVVSCGFINFKIYYHECEYNNFQNCRRLE